MHFVHHRFEPLHTQDENEPVGKHRKDEIGQRTRGHDGDPASHGLPVERPGKILHGDLPLPLVQHLDIPPERDRTDHILGRIRPFPPPPQRLAEPDGEAQHLDSQPACHPEMAELVHRHEDTDGNQKRKQRGQETVHALL